MVTPGQRKLAQQIGWRLEEFVSAGSAAPRPLRELARVLGALPLQSGARGTIAIRRDGTLVYVRDGAIVADEIDARERLIALVVGAETYPELRELLPRRAEDAHACPACDGTGLPLSDEAFHLVRCGTCCGLGFVPTPVGNASSA